MPTKLPQSLSKPITSNHHNQITQTKNISESIDQDQS